MLDLKQLNAFFWEIDPGYFRLKHATKTIVAILITLLLVRNESLVTKAMACISCAVSMQGSFAKNYLWRVGQVVLFDIFYFASFSLGLVIRDSANLKAVALVVLGFTVNYSRRFGLQTSVAPLMIWLLCFMATILPFNSSAEAWNHIHGLIIGLIVSAVIMLGIFPENYRRLYIDNSNRFFNSLAEGLNEMRRYLLLPKHSLNFYHYPFVRTKESLNRLLDSNQSIDQSDIFDEQQENLISELMLSKYALAQAYTIMIDAYRNLITHPHFLSKEIRLRLSVITNQLSQWFASAKMDKTYRVSAKRIEISFEKFLHTVSKEKITEPDLVMTILNLNLSLRFMVQQFDKLLGCKHEN
ncbi:hypothetical protein [Legionella jamestowniensis]|uniref:Uncharacterized protein n=1 Tax=Legionella jamestowniensis TaxID=455 RepID=A0A0W0UYJ9_9GAMM|nr:hypothetical protein [Legionella jamestowniensis]KTD12960.1 hypothetical protein Ljam_0218 [Legionella jamestowniensis]OCH98253.1 hypothetical protein A8135_11860 [Legionella jamestowniensis]SFL78707.1 hypothetical protein SAMN02746073_1935 [Legionella jamestowniensis DSM 19215]